MVISYSETGTNKTISRHPGAFASSTARTVRSPNGFVNDRPVLGRFLVMIDVEIRDDMKV